MKEKHKKFICKGLEMIFFGFFSIAVSKHSNLEGMLYFFFYWQAGIMQKRYKGRKTDLLEEQERVKRFEQLLEGYDDYVKRGGRG